MTRAVASLEIYRPLNAEQSAEVVGVRVVVLFRRRRRRNIDSGRNVFGSIVLLLSRSLSSPFENIHCIYLISHDTFSIVVTAVTHRPPC